MPRTKQARTGDTIEFENVTIMYPNFSGDPTTFNPAGGKRTFNVRINDLSMGELLTKQGWNVKPVFSRDEEDTIAFYSLPVEVKFNENYKRLNPTVFQVTSRNKVRLNEETISYLDNVDIKSADLVVRAYEWEVGGRTGIKAYLQTGYFVIEEDHFAHKYDYDNDIPF